MEWAELLIGLIGGGLGGTILGRVWDNQREDRFRHVEVKREVATAFHRSCWEHVLLATARANATRALEAGVGAKVPPEAVDEQVRESLGFPASSALQSHASIKGELMRIELMFGHEVIEAATKLYGLATSDSQSSNLYFTTPEVRAFVAAVRKELGVPPRRNPSM